VTSGGDANTAAGTCPASTTCSPLETAGADCLPQ
jgi:hypothetical protein